MSDVYYRSMITHNTRHQTGDNYIEFKINYISVLLLEM